MERQRHKLMHPGRTFPPGALLLLLLVLTGCSRFRPEQEPIAMPMPADSPCLSADIAGPQAFAEALRRHLDDEVLPFWTAPGVVDSLHGGYLTGFNTAGHACDPDANKPLIAQLRLLYVHAVAIEHTDDAEQRRRLRNQYDQGFTFVENHYLDTAGGWIAETRRDGSVLNAEKQSVVQAYVVYIMSELWQRLCDSRARDLAVQAFAWMDEHAHDAAHGGYVEYGELPLDDRRNALKSTGTQLHVMLGLARLFPLAPTEQHRQRLEEIVDLLARHPNSDPNANPPLYVTHDWTPAPWAEGTELQQTLYGHTAETVWYTLDALHALGRSPVSLRPWLTEVADGVITRGLMDDGGVYVWGPDQGPGTDADDIRWWPQTEAMIMLARLARLTGDSRIMQRFEEVSRFTFAHLVPDQSGAWLGGINRQTGELSPRGGWAWKSGLHVVRALVECEQALRQEADPWPPERPPRAQPRRAAQLEPGFAYYRDRSAASIVAEFQANDLDCIHLICLTDQVPIPGLVQEARRQGVETWGTFFPTGIYMPASLFGDHAESWRMQFSHESSFSGYRFYSYVHEGYQAWWKQHLVGFYDREHFDGMLFYEVHYPTHAGPTQSGPKPLFSDVSPGFRHAFARATGREDFPEFTAAGAPDYYETDTTLFQDFVEFRLRSIVDFQREILDGDGGFRQRFPEVMFATWTISLARDGALAALRSNESQDPGRLIAALRPDAHMLQSHYPDWYPQEQSPAYLSRYAPYAAAVHAAQPGLPIGVQLDVCSTCPWRRSPEWMAEACRNAADIGADITTYYEFSLRWEVYFAPPRAVRSSLDDAGNATITFDQRIAPESVRHLEDLPLEDGITLKDIRVDGNLLHLRLEGQQPGRTLSIPLDGITDDPRVRLPLPDIGPGDANAIPPGTRVTLAAVSPHPHP